MNSLVPDGNEGLLVAGEFSGTLEFGGEPRTSAGGRDGYVARLDAEGRELRLQPLGGIGFQAATSVATTATGRLVVAGRFSGALHVGEDRLGSAGGSDVFLASFDADGAPLWSERFGDGFDQQARAVAMDERGNAIVVGDFAGTLDLGGDPLGAPGISMCSWRASTRSASTAGASASATRGRSGPRRSRWTGPAT